MRTFRSKIDWWVLGFIISMSGLLIQLLLTMYAKGTMAQYPEHSVVYLLTIVVLWLPILTTRYVVNGEELSVRSLLFKWTIPLNQIQKITETDLLDISPALSLKRLKIEYLQDGQHKQILVSPRDQQAFFQALN